MNLRTKYHTDVRSNRRTLALVTLAFMAVGALALVDLVSDLNEGATPAHFAIEAIIGALGATGTCFGVRQILMLRKQTQELRQQASEMANRLNDSHEEAQRWREKAHELLLGLGALIDEQLTRWGLTEAEKRIAFLILKGLSHKEIATLRKVGSATVRQQAASVYKKSGVSGRHELSAFFLEDLLAPRHVNAESPTMGK